MAILPWSGIKKVFKILKSSLSPNQIAFSFALGIFAGLPPMGMHVIIPITLASDAHFPHEAAWGHAQVVAAARRAGYTERLRFHNRVGELVPLEDSFSSGS